MTTIIRGLRLDAPSAQPGLIGALGSLPVATAGALDMSASVRDAATFGIDLDALDAANTLCEIELDDGMHLWLRPDELADDRLFERHAQRDGTIVLRPATRTQRGLGRFAARILRVFKADPVKTFGTLAREGLIDKLETAIRPALYSAANGLDRLEPFPDTAAATAPYLLMLHGTASSTAGSFGGLAQANGGQRWKQLQAYYGARMLALEHRTLSVHPLQNALDAVEALPGGARLHLLSHSRGGLIGELLARSSGGRHGFDPDELALFTDITAATDPALAVLLRRLDEALRDRRIVVERFVRVACPARGTTLVSARLRDWLTVVCNLVARLLKTATSAGLTALGAPPVAHDIAGCFFDLLKAVTLEVVRIDDIPGLHAMDPASPFIRGLINGPYARSADRLAIISGDTEGSGVFGRLKTFAVDRFFQHDNDLVVDTPSMTGGARREGPVRHAARGPETTHFSYFRESPTAERIVAGLTAAQLDGSAGFIGSEIDQAPLRAPLRTPATRSDRDDLPIVFLLPGIMGSQLECDGELVWLNHFKLIRGGFALLEYAAAGDSIKAVALDGDTYQALADFLAATHEVIPFPYDWRRPIDESAARLNTMLLDTLARIDRRKRPIRIVAHSMGGLVARAMMLRDDSAWPAICAHPQARLLMMGTPNQGSHAISLLLTGEEKLVRMLALADLRNTLHDTVRTATGFRGALDMIPSATDRDYFDQASWQELATALPAPWPLPQPDDLSAARAFRGRLDQQQLDPARVFYVAGMNSATPVGVEVVKKRILGLRLKFLATAEGDGRVPWKGGIPPGVRAWYVDAVHGDIPKHRRAHEGYRQLLEHGDTGLLPTRPISARGIPGETFEYPIEPVNFLPDQADLHAAALGRATETVTAALPALPHIDVRVQWANLRYAKFPVVVGHYVGDTIVSAERTLDHFLDEALSRRLALGRYPGPLGTALVIPNPSGALPGAVVVGLGQVQSRLSRSNLVRAIQAGVSEWAVRMLETSEECDDRPERETAAGQAPEAPPARGLVFVAVGSGAGGMPLRETGTAILDGIRSALEVLRMQRGIGEVERLRLAQIDFLELYEDRAHSLWKGLSDALGAHGNVAALAGVFGFAEGDDRVITGKDGRRRLLIEEANDWWPPLKISANGEHIVFENIGDRARAELYGVGTHTQQIDALTGEATSAYRHRDGIAKALFELMIPNDLKENLPTLDRVRLIVDTRTACYPWEIILSGGGAGALRDREGARAASDGRTGLGLIRQFSTDDFRSRPRQTENRTALVIGDPLTGGGLVQLPGAHREAGRVRELLRQASYRLADGEPRSALEILIALYAAPYQILHFAGHGVTDGLAWLARHDPAQGAAPSSTAGAPAVYSAMVIGEHQILSHMNVEQMSSVPELVFINCCHLGAINHRASSMAADFGAKFIKIGVRALVAAGWPVDDDAAELFATRFYQALLHGESFGDAVRDARQLTKAQYPDSSTWAAYQCYGDPSYRLVPAASHAGHGTSARAPRYGSPRHLAYEAIQQADSIERLRDLVALAEAHRFAADGELCAEIAERLRRLNDFDQAIHWYLKALGCEDGQMSLRGIEQFFNLSVRTTATRVGPVEGAITDIDRLIGFMEQINAHTPTTERLCLLGSAHKRKARLLAHGPARIDALERAAQAYEQAGALLGPTAHPYPLINACIFRAALNMVTGAEPHGSAARAAFTAANARKGKHPIREFWDYAVDAELILCSVYAGTRKPSATATRELVNSYQTAYRRAHDKGVYRSVIEQIEIMRELLPQTPANGMQDDVSRLRDWLNALRALVAAGAGA